MQINHYTDYAYRVLMYLAVNTRQRVTMAEIAAYYGISHEHLRKVVHRLSGLNYITTYTGKGGGMELARPAEKINIGDVFVEFEGMNSLIDCEDSHCPLTGACSLSQLFASAQNAFLNEIKSCTLADLMQKTRMVKMLFNH